MARKTGSTRKGNTTTTTTTAPAPAATPEMVAQVAAQVAAETIFGSNAVAYMHGELFAVGVKAAQYKPVTVTNWKKWCNTVPEVGNVVRWGSGITWEIALKTAQFKRALEAHQRATLEAHNAEVKTA